MNDKDYIKKLKRQNNILRGKLKKSSHIIEDQNKIIEQYDILYGHSKNALRQVKKNLSSDTSELDKVT